MILTRILKVGLAGDDIKLLQERLTELGFFNGRISSKFDARTQNAVRDFQDNKGLNVDGTIGLSTWELMFSKDIAPKPLIR